MGANADSTAVPEKDLPAEPASTLLNLPEDMDAAISRIMELEMRLDDLARAAEIAEACRDINMLGPFAKAAMTSLEKKITIEHKQQDINITVVVDDDDESTNATTTP
jgi:hypothetical protein